MSDQPVATDSDVAPEKEDFAALLEESYGAADNLEGTVVAGWVIGIENDMAVIDVGLKAEGRVSLREFALPGQTPEIKIGDSVEVYLERMENVHGEAALSREKARREEAWVVLEEAFAKNERVQGNIFGRVKGGFTVDLSGAVAFLPGSQVDIRPVRDIGPLMGAPQEFQILKMDRRRGNIVVSRRAVLEETRAEARSDLVASLHEGQVLEGVVKNVTDYGAFVDLGGIDGLLHVTDIAWRRINHPTEVLSIGETVKVQVIRVNPETQRISLGMKQLEANPWDGVEAKYPVEMRLAGRVTNITDYGAFVELEPGVEGLVHVSEMSWTKKNVHPGKIVSTSQQVEVMVLDVDPIKRRISLGLKQISDNPWTGFLENHPTGSEVEGEIKSITEFGLFVGLEGDIDGMVHLSDLDWSRPGDVVIAEYKKGDVVKAKVLDVDIEKERISLGIKHLEEDPYRSIENLKRGDTVTCAVAEIRDNGINVTVADGAVGFIRRADLARERSEQRPDRFAVGNKVDAMVSAFDRDTRKLTLSIKALEAAEEKAAMEQYGSTDSGASLGDILGAAIARQEKEREETSAEEGADDTAEEATEAAAEEGADDIAEVATEAAAEEGANDIAEVATEAAAAEGADDTAEVATEAAAEQGADDTAEVATETAAAEGADDTAEVAKEAAAEEGADDTAEVAKEAAAEEGADDTAGEATEAAAGQGADDTAEVATEASAEESTEDATEDEAEKG